MGLIVQIGFFGSALHVSKRQFFDAVAAGVFSW